MLINNAFLSRIVILFVFAVTLFSCSTYQNVTAYFNTYYNAKTLFDKAVTDLSHTTPAGKDTNYFVMQTVKSDGQSNFDKVIEKCSKIIQYYPQSSVVDDAILMIGESYVYMGEYEGAVRKFKELLDNFPASDKRLQAKLWYAKAEFYNNKSDDAVKMVEELLPEANNAGENDIALEASMLKAQIYFNSGEYDRATEQYEKAVKIYGSKPLLTASYFQLAQTYQRLNNYTKAAQTYASLIALKPDVNLRYKATLQYGKMNVLLKNYDQALQTFTDLKYDAIKKEDVALAEVEIANTYNAMGDTSKAFPMYNRIDTVYRRTEASGKSYYQQGLYYENLAKDYKKAFDYYSKAVGEYSAPDFTPNAKLKSDRFTTYFKLQTNLFNYDSLLWTALHPDTTSKLNPTKSDTSNVGKDSLSLQRSSFAHLDSAVQRDSVRQRKVENPANMKNDVDSIEMVQKNRPPNFSPNLSHRGRGHDNRGEDENMRNDTANYDDALVGNPRLLRGGMNGLKDSTSMKSNSFSSIPQLRATALTPDSLRFLILQSKFELGGLFMLELDQQDSALVYYQQVVSEDSSQRLTPRTLYALAEIYGTRHDSVTVDSLYKRILNEYGKTEYARQVKKLMSKETQSAEIDPAETQYKDAEKLLTSGKTKEALKMFKKLSSQNSISPIIPKAQYAVGWIYENVLLENDSAAQWYRQLVKAYPNSIYAEVAQPKVAVKDNPDTLSHFLKVKEIPLVAKEPSRRGRENISAKEGKSEQVNQQAHRRRGNEEVDEEQDKEKDTDEDNSDDDNN